MELNILIQNTLATTGILNCSITALFLLLERRGNAKANIFLALLSLAISLKLAFALLSVSTTDWGLTGAIIYYFSVSAYFSIGPLLFLYFFALQKQEISPMLTLSMFIPTLFPFIGQFFDYYIPLWMLQSYFFIFLVIIYYHLNTFFKMNQNDHSFKSKKMWMSMLFASFVCIWLVVNLLFVDFKFYLLELTMVLTATFYINFYTIFKYYWVRKGDAIEPQKYKNSALSIEEEDEILRKLIHLMDNESLYVDFEISLPKVADLIESKPYKVSLVINKRMNMTFNEFINSYRIKAISRLIKSPEYQNTKIASIAYDYGFNSISSFNTAFKKFMNCTPSEFRLNSQNF